MAKITWEEYFWNKDNIIVQESKRKTKNAISLYQGADSISYVKKDKSIENINAKDIEMVIFKEAKLLRKGSITIYCNDLKEYKISFRKTPVEYYILFDILGENGIKIHNYK